MHMIRRQGALGWICGVLCALSVSVPEVGAQTAVPKVDAGDAAWVLMPLAQGQAGVSGEPVAASTRTAPLTEERPWFLKQLFNAYVDEFNPPSAAPSVEPEPARRAQPAPWDSPPYPSSEYQGSPLIGVPVGTKEYPLMKALGGTSLGELMRESRIKTYGWVNGSYNWSNANNSNQPTSYWIIPKSIVLEQAVLRFEREVDTVQTEIGRAHV